MLENRNLFALLIAGVPGAGVLLPGTAAKAEYLRARDLILPEATLSDQANAQLVKEKRSPAEYQAFRFVCARLRRQATPPLTRRASLGDGQRGVFA